MTHGTVTEEAIRKLRPFCGRVLVSETQVDEEERRSGLVVPITLSDELKRGVVTRIDHDCIIDPAVRDAIRMLDVGSVVYFRATSPRYGDAAKILDVYVLEPSMILAYESDE